MDSIQEMIKSIFGDPVTINSIMSAIVTVYAFVVSLWNVGAKKRVIKADLQATKYADEASKAKVAADSTKEAIGILSNMLLTVFLNANTLDVETKKQLANAAKQLDNLTDVKLLGNVKTMLNKVQEHNPEATIVEKHDELVKQANETKKKLTEMSEETTNFIDKLKL